MDKALAESCSTALADMLDYIERQAQLALETSGDTISRWVDTYA